MDKFSLDSCLDEITARFAPRQPNSSLRTQDCPALASFSGDVFGAVTPNDRDLNNLLAFVVRFYEGIPLSREQKANLRAGLAFLFCHYMPNDRDYALIKLGNPRLKDISPALKQVRDTWAFMVYKRTLLFDPEQSYSAKPGQTLRPVFRDAVLDAFSFAFNKLQLFRPAVTEMLQEQRSRRLLVLPTELEPLERGENSAERKVDASEYVTETIPDGTLLPTNTTVTKTWTLKNVGEVPWIGRKFRRMTPMSVSYPASLSEVPVADTLPGETVVIAVEVTTSSIVGFSEVKFKMVDAQGNLCWPDDYPHGALMAIETQNLVWTQREMGDVHRRWED